MLKCHIRWNVVHNHAIYFTYPSLSPISVTPTNPRHCFKRGRALHKNWKMIGRVFCQFKRDQWCGTHSPPKSPQCHSVLLFQRKCPILDKTAHNFAEAPCFCRNKTPPLSPQRKPIGAVDIPSSSTRVRLQVFKLKPQDFRLHFDAASCTCSVI